MAGMAGTAVRAMATRLRRLRAATVTRHHTRVPVAGPPLLQPDGADLISSARLCTFAAGGKFFPTAEASMMRGWFGRAGGAAGGTEGSRPPIAGVPGAQSPDRLTWTFGGAPVPGSEYKKLSLQLPVPEVTDVMTTPD